VPSENLVHDRCGTGTCTTRFAVNTNGIEMTTTIPVRKAKTNQTDHQHDGRWLSATAPLDRKSSMEWATACGITGTCTRLIPAGAPRAAALFRLRAPLPERNDIPDGAMVTRCPALAWLSNRHDFRSEVGNSRG